MKNIHRLVGWAPPTVDRRGVHATRPRVAAWLSALGLTLLLLTSSARAFEPMPPVMQSLLKIFPEENGRFVDEPFGVDSLMPDQAKQFYQTFRVVVPSVDDLEKNLARLFAAAPDLPVKKITRYDKDPGAPGLPGFRGIWCQLEDEKQIGFTILTVNQNRFLIWAKMAYYPSLAIDSINQKVRDQYARDVSQYLAGIDMKVPENDPPPASGRGLPQEIDLMHPTTADAWGTFGKSIEPVLHSRREIQLWGIKGVTAFKPTDSTLAEIISNAPDSLKYNKDPEYLQLELDQYVKGNCDSESAPTPLKSLDGILPNGRFLMAIDRFGRVRVVAVRGEGRHTLQVECLFPGTAILTTGYMEYFHPEGSVAQAPLFELFVCPTPNRYSYSMAKETSPEQVLRTLDEQLLSLGHLFMALKDAGIQIEPYNILVSRLPR